MSRIGRYDTDSGALRARIGAHERYSSGDMTGWALGQLGARTGDRVLDLGAGTGQQALRLAPQVAEVVAVDASEESLAALREQAPVNVVTFHGRFDELAARECDRSFDRVISAYAMYYVDDPRRLLTRVRELMADGAVLFACGPAYDNNAELRSFHHGVAGTDPPGPTPAATFMEETLPALCDELFGGHERTTFENWLRFDDGEALLDYWRNYNLHDPALEDRFAEAARARGAFATAKRVVGIRALA
jgi:SAM-dependent methyltransferase